MRGGKAMSEIKVTKSGFQTAKARQKSALLELRTVYQNQQKMFGNLKSSWSGKSADAFKKGSKELLCENLMAQLTLNDLKRKTTFAEMTFKEADETLKKNIEKK